jgi:quercetin dioxygenase-like cupin family protein
LANAKVLNKGKDHLSMQLSTNSPYALAPGAGKPMAWFDATITLKASCPEMGVTEVTIRPGEEPPFHIHQKEDEWFYLLEGEVRFHVGTENYQGLAGTFVSFPRGIPHTFTVESPSAHFLVLNTPGGFEHMFELGPRTPDEAVHAMATYGMDVVAPHPRQAAA